MNTQHDLARRQASRGAALVITLAILVLLVALTMAIFLSSANERRGASLFKNSQGLLDLNETAVNLVMAQIKDATTTNATAAPADRLTWASQPGMIRTYGAGTNAVASYKLYSWADPRPAGDANDTVPADWKSRRALYVDLNEPVVDSTNSSTLRYPIAYPPSTNTATAPAGYSVATNAPGFESNTNASPTNNPVPMPVQWLYVLRNGEMVYPSASSGNTATIPGATVTNPIVGRIAYWTDDETSKVNLNTAAGGPFWMTPVYATTVQQGFANYQPMQFEFQRFPGHQARTDLRAVFPDLTQDSATNSVYAFAPRIQFGGSMRALAQGTNAAGNTNAVIMDSDRLFASVGEARFSANSTAPRSNFAWPAGDWTDRIERNRFLVTTSSRAPETTLFGTPRLSIWPIPANSANRTAYDELIAFNASLNTASGVAPFYFDRINSLSSTTDISRTRNVELLGYLDAMMKATSIPGSGRAGFSAKGSDIELAQLQTQIFDYIRCVNLTDTHPLTGNAISFSRGSLVVPATREVNSTTTRGFGRYYTVNQFGIIFAATADGFRPPLWSSTVAYPVGAEVTFNGKRWKALAASTNVPPEPANASWGLNDSNVPANKSLVPSGGGNATLLAPNETRVMPLPVVELAVPSAGVGGIRPDLAGGVSIRIRNLDAISINTTNAPWSGLSSANLGDLPNAGSLYNNSGNIWEKNNGGYLFHSTPVRSGPSAFKDMRGVNGFSGSASGYPVGEAFTVPSASSMTVSSGSPILIDIIPNANPSDVITVEIPPFSTSVLAPNLLSSSTAWSWHKEGIGFTTTPDTRLEYVPPPPLPPIKIDSRTSSLALYTVNGPAWASAGLQNSPVDSVVALGLVFNDESRPLLASKGGDSVVALATKHGDYRAVMTRPEAAVDNFSVVPDGWNQRFRHRFFSPFARNINNSAGDIRPASAVNNWDVPGGNAETNSMGIVRPRGNDYQTHPRIPRLADYPTATHPRDWSDFDNGYPQIPDGPYINKPNEGEIVGTGASMGTMPYFGQTRGESLDLSNPANVNAIAWSSPSREIASPVAFGSLPSGSLLGRPWQNLLFRPSVISTNIPAPSAGGVHPGSSGMRWDGTAQPTAPPDHYLLDYFWMPTVEPYAISERFSTAGKINLNTAIAPFSYIQRDTAIHALLMNEMMPTVSSTRGPGNWSLGTGGYTKLSADSNTTPGTLERMIDIPATLQALAVRRVAGGMFTSASQVCEVPIIPLGPNGTAGPGFAGINAFWAGHRMTGDNLRELPYNNIYQRITTRSNTYTVHHRVQVLQKVAGGDPAVWDEQKDVVVAEARGQTLLERYLDPNAEYPDYAKDFANARSLEDYYRFRIIRRAEFTP